MTAQFQGRRYRRYVNRCPDRGACVGVLAVHIGRFAGSDKPLFLHGSGPSHAVLAWLGPVRQTVRSTIIFLMFAMASAGFRPLGQVFAQFMMVWQR